MWNIVMYEKENGKTPVKEFLDALESKQYAKAIREIDLLEKHGMRLTEPHVKHIGDKMWELRIKFSNDISRIFYFFPIEKDIVLLHGFVKKTMKTPIGEIKKAKSYMEDYKRRNNLL